MDSNKTPQIISVKILTQTILDLQSMTLVNNK